MAKRYSLHLRSTLGSWGDPCYNLGETSDTTRDGLTFRWMATQSSAADYGSVNHARLSGRRSPTTAAQKLRITLPDGPGKYRLWLAIGALSTTTTCGAVVTDSLGATVLTVAESSTTGGNVKDATGASMSAANWLKSNVSLIGTAQAGSSASITLASDASAVDGFYVGKTVEIGSGTGSGQYKEITAYDGTTKVATIRGTWTTAPDATSGYTIYDGGGTYVEFTTTGTYIEIARPSSRMDLACVELEYVPDPLTAASISEESGSGTLSAIWSHEPAGKKIGKISSASGAQSFSVIGAASTWFAVATIDGAPWLVSTATRIPANLASLCANITIRQTTPYEIKDTDIATPTVVDCSARDLTGYLGAITSRTWMERKAIRDVTRGELWPGYQGQSFASDIAVNSDSAFATAYNALSPDGTSWYRIRLQEGGAWDYTAGNGRDLSGEKNFGTGGLLIEPDAGHDPIIRTKFYKLQGHGVHWRNSLLIPAGTYSFLNEIMYGFTKWPKLRIEGNRIGHMFDAGETVANWASWNSFILDRFHDQLALIDNIVWGVDNFMINSGGRLTLEEGTEYRMTPVADFHRCSVGYYLDTPRGVFADNHCYVELANIPAINNPDQFTGLAAGSIKHGDWAQTGRPGDGYMYAYSAYPNGNTSATWSVGNKCLNTTEKKVYEVQSVTTGVGSGTAPSGGAAAGSIVDGGVTWVYHSDFTLEATMHILMENVGLHTDGTTSSTDSGSAKIAPSHQVLQPSNAGMLCPNKIVVINSIFATGAGRGIDAGWDGELHMELTSLVGPAERPIDGTTAVTLSNQYCTAGTIRAFNNILGYNSSSTIPSKVDLRNGSDFLAYQGNRAIDWTGGAGAPYRPGDVLSGSFTSRTGGSWGYALNETNAVDVVMSDLSKIMHPANGLAGGRATEYHVVTISDAASGSVQKTLTIAP